MLKIPHGEVFNEFTSWLLDWQQEPNEEGKGILWSRYKGTYADVYELWGNVKLVAYAKLKWG